MKITIKQWNDFFIEKGVAPSSKRAYLRYINKLNYKGLPIVFELLHLSIVLGIKYKVLVRMVNRPEAFYYSFSLPKRRGGTRSINAPFPLLKFVQHWILTQILSKITLHDNAMAYRKGLSIMDNARKHLRNKDILKMDFKNYFPSIAKRRIISIFQYLGYSNKVSYYLASLCCYEGVLPQGACTSPYLSNIVTKKIDKKYSQLSFDLNLQYSRYADDITFSGDKIENSIIEKVKNIAEENGFRINDEKTLLIKGSKKKIITGISVSGKKMKLPKEKRRKLRQEFHCIRKFGLDVHMKINSITDPIYLERLIGKFNYWLQIEPENKFALRGLEYLRKLRIESAK